jgi:multiple antibiotic resistance protein
MEFNLKEIFTATMILFAVIDIIGSIPIIIDLRQKVGHIQYNGYYNINRMKLCF